MFGRLVLVFLSIVVLLAGVSCTTPESEGFNQVCPEWTEYTAQSRCDIRIFKYSTDLRVNLDVWEQLRMTVVGSEILIAEDTNIRVFTDQGVLLDYRTMRLAAGTYIVRKEEGAQPAEFEITSPLSNKAVHISGELVRPAQS